ncbi:hypothetical protein Hanom_Chr04g00375391 [Helianthus anomalus]
MPLERRKNANHRWNGGILSRWRMELPQHHPPTRKLMIIVIMVCFFLVFFSFNLEKW